MINLGQLSTFFETAFLFFLGIFGRYALIAFLFHYLFRIKFKSQFALREVNIRPRKPRQDWQEISHSLITSVIFAIAAAAIMLAWQRGYTKMYSDWRAYSPIWLVLSVVIVLVVHETYYYWLHRWMHHPSVYKIVHKAHHDSITTSAWTSFSFHPFESVLQAIVLPAMLFIIPIHVAAVAFILVLMTISSVINHLNTELYPKDFYTHWFGKWWIGATHHSLHHSQFKYNYGLYFTFWDRWMNTESPDFKVLFDKRTKKADVEIK